MIDGLPAAEMKQDVKTGEVCYDIGGFNLWVLPSHLHVCNDKLTDEMSVCSVEMTRLTLSYRRSTITTVSLTLPYSDHYLKLTLNYRQTSTCDTTLETTTNSGLLAFWSTQDRESSPV